MSASAAVSRYNRRCMHAGIVALLKGEDVPDKLVQTSLGTIAHAICQGGWPGAIGRSERAAGAIPSPPFKMHGRVVCDPSDRAA